MPRKRKTDETPLKEPAISDMTDTSESEQALSAKGISREESEDAPFAEIIAEMGNDDEKLDVPHFAEADSAPISTSGVDSDVLDAAIQEAIAHARPTQDKPASGSTIAYEQPVLLATPRRQVFPPEIAPPPPVVLAAAGLMLIFLLAF